MYYPNTVAGYERILGTGMEVEYNVILLIVGSCLSALTILFNIIMAISMIIGKNYNTLTLSAFHLLVLDLVVGACILPLSTSLYYKEVWVFDQVICGLWITLDSLIPSLIMVTCVVINLDHILQLTHAGYRLSRESWSWKHFLFIWVPWFSVLAVATPMIVIGSQKDELTGATEKGVCYEIWNQPYQWIYIGIVYFTPAFFSITTVIIAVIIYCIVNRRQQYDHVSMASTISILLLNLTTLALLLPFIVVIFAASFGYMYTASSLQMLIFHWLSLSLSTIRPLIWLTNPEIRSAYVVWFQKCCCRYQLDVYEH